MASDLSQDAVLGFLYSRNGKARNSELLNHFRVFLREDENRAQNRELFKKFVNSVAVVRQEEGVSFVVLKRRYMVHAGDVGVASSRKTVLENDKNLKQRGSSGEEKQKDEKSHSAQSSRSTLNTSIVLHAAGIVSNVNTAHLENDSKHSLFSAFSGPPAVTDAVLHNSARTLQSPNHKALNGTEKWRDQDSDKAVVTTTCEQHNVNNIKIGHSRVQCIEENSSYQPQEYSYSANEDCLSDYAVHNSADRAGNERRADTCTAGSGYPLSITSRDDPCSSSDVESHNAPNNRVISQETTLRNEYTLSQQESQEGVEFQQRENNGVAFTTHPRCQNLEGTFTNTTYSDCYRSGLSASYGNLLLPYENTEWSEGSSKGDWASDEGLNSKGLSGVEGFKVHQMLKRAEESKAVSFVHNVESRVNPWHHSTGNLTKGVSKAVVVPLRSRDHKARNDFRSRLCRSLGADLDKPFHEDITLARRNRLHLLSSSLSINYHLSRPPEISRYESVSFEKGTNSYFHRSTVVPLDSKEHQWLIKAASGCWTDIYSLFREDPGLLSKRDFISGYTVLHWIAKHGDHRVLNTLWYGVNKAGMNLDIDTKTTCGYTPLHLAAIHGHKKLIRLLVHKFKANISLRDTSGKKPWQYLGVHGSRDLSELLGAPQHKAVDGKTSVLSYDKLLVHPKPASPKVKRQTSVAAFLKHKSLLKVQNHSDSFV